MTTRSPNRSASTAVVACACPPTSATRLDNDSGSRELLTATSWPASTKELGKCPADMPGADDPDPHLKSFLVTLIRSKSGKIADRMSLVMTRGTESQLSWSAPTASPETTEIGSTLTTRGVASHRPGEIVRA